LIDVQLGQATDGKMGRWCDAKRNDGDIRCVGEGHEIALHAALRIAHVT
jgi:hypothetical protein